MTYGEFPPSPLLAPFVECYWVVTFEQSPFQPLEILVPDGRTEIIFNEGAAYKRFRDHQRTQVELIHSNHLIGIRERAIFLESMDHVQFFAIRFRPGGLFSLLQIPALELTQQFIPLEALFNRLAKNLEERLFDALSLEDKIRVTETLLWSQLKNAAVTHPMLEAILQYIYALKGNCTIDKIVKKYKIGYKKLERHFQKVIGCSPKSFIKMVRFGHAVRMIQHCPKLSMTDVAYEAGYYDQAHFNREFRYFAGDTPKAFQKRQYTISRVIQPKVSYEPTPCFQI